MKSAILPLAVFALMLMGCFEGPVGPPGAQGPKGDSGATGSSLTIYQRSGTILNKNYTAANPAWASIWVCYFPCFDPTVLFVGIESASGTLTNTAWVSVIYGGTDPAYGYDGLAGYYVLISDPSKTLLQKNYKIKYTYN